METRFFSDPHGRLVLGFSGPKDTVTNIGRRLKTLAERFANGHPAFRQLTQGDQNIWLTSIFRVITQRFRNELNQERWTQHFQWKPVGVFAEPIRRDLATGLGTIIDGILDFTLRPLVGQPQRPEQSWTDLSDSERDSERTDLNNFLISTPGLEEVTLFLPAPERAAV